MNEIFESINWGMVWSLLTMFAFSLVFMAPISKIMFISEYGREKGENEWIKFTSIFIALFFVGIVGVWYCAS